jgi:hypothetical protein
MANLAAGYSNLYDAAARAVALIRAEQAPGQGACARVSLRIDQSAVMTRSAFTGTLEFSNQSASSLLNVGITLDIRDANQQSATNLFGTALLEWSGFGGPNGSATLPTLSTGRGVWRIVPSPDAATNGPTVYFVGGTLTYVQDGRTVTIPLYPQRIVVWPQPRLAFQYFLPRDVYSDDPFTPEIEPAEPFSLGLLVNNRGVGAARNLSITTAQPEIVDNERDLLVDFQILGSQVGDQPGSPSLTVQLGDIQPGGTAVATWQMTASLSGRFLGLQASYQHLDALGNLNLSLVESVDTHDLIHVVKATTPGSDNVPDFLVDDVADLAGLPDRLYLSDGTVATVGAVTNALVETPPGGGASNRLVVAAMPAGWAYLRIADPAPASYRLVHVIRTNDSVALLLGYNVWTTHRVVRPLGQAPYQEDLLHLLDYNTGGSYLLVYEPIPADTNAPTSSVAELPAQSFAFIPLSWSGEDNSGGSGLAYFDIYASVNNGPFTLWLGQTTLRSAVFVGQQGNHYAFYSVAADVAGNREAAPGTPDAQTTVSLTNTAPVLSPIGDRTVNEGETLSIPCAATDAEVPPQSLTYSLAPGAPPGMVIDPQTGVITWATGEAHGDSVNPITVIVTDNGVPQMSDSKSFTVFVRDINSPPSVCPQPLVAVSVGDQLSITNCAFDPDIPAQTLRFSLGWVSDSSATINPTNGVFRWRPATAFGSTTNYFEIVATDDGRPPLSATQVVTVLVNDYLALGLGRTNVLAQQFSSVPLAIYSSAGVGDLQFNLNVNVSHLTNVALVPVPGRFLSSTFQEIGRGGWYISLTTEPENPLLGTEHIAQLSFKAVSTQSAFVPLLLSNISAARPERALVPKIVGQDGRVVVIASESLLEAKYGPTGQPTLTLYGKPGSSYMTEHKTNLLAGPWLPGWRVPMTNLSRDFGLAVDKRAEFYRAYEFFADPPILQLGGSSNLVLLLYGRAGTNYVIQTTTKMVKGADWIPLTNFVLTNSFRFLDGGQPTNRAQFYRTMRP